MVAMTLLELPRRKLAKKRVVCESPGVTLPEKASAAAPVRSLVLSLVSCVTLRSTWLLSRESMDEL